MFAKRILNRFPLNKILTVGSCLIAFGVSGIASAEGAPPSMVVAPAANCSPAMPRLTKAMAPVTAPARNLSNTAQSYLLPQASAAERAPGATGLGPAAPHPIWAVDSTASGPCGQAGEPGWDARGMVNWQQYAQGEYIGNGRTAHVPTYRLRVDDSLAIFYLRTRKVLSKPYELQVGDQVQVESLTAGSSSSLAGGEGSSSAQSAEDSLNRIVVVQPDGMITLPLIGRIPAARRQVVDLQQDLEERFKAYYNVPSITVTPVRVNTRLEDLLDTVDNRGGQLGGRQLNVVITPSGKVQVPGLGSVYLQGLTLAEAKSELDARYKTTIPGIQVTVDLIARAPRFIYVLGEVTQPGQFQMTGPTTTMQAIALAGGWQTGANLRQVIVFRRGDDWRLMATMLDLRGALYGRRPAPADEIWLRDADIILIPKTTIEAADELIEQVFTRGLYAAIPLELIWGQGFTTVSSIISSF